MRTPARLARATAQPWTGPESELLIPHRAFIRTLPCLSCGKPPPSECARPRMHAGLGLPSSDRYLVPLCGPPTVWENCCHSRQQFLGSSRFWSGLGIDPRNIAFRLWRVSGNYQAGLRIVMHAQRVIAASCRDPDKRNGDMVSPSRAGRRGAELCRIEPLIPGQRKLGAEIAFFSESR